MFAHYHHILSGFIDTARTGSVYVTLAVTIERYFAVVRPFDYSRLRKLLLPLVFVFATIYNFPKVIHQSGLEMGFNFLKSNPRNL